MILNYCVYSVVSRCRKMPRNQIFRHLLNPDQPLPHVVDLSPCPPHMPSARLVAVFAAACINLNIASAIAYPPLFGTLPEQAVVSSGPGDMIMYDSRTTLCDGYVVDNDDEV